MAAHENRDVYQDRDTDSGMVTAERGVAWLFAIGAIALALVGLLRGFGFVGPEGVEVPGIGEAGGIQAAVQSDFWEAMVWMLPALAASAMAWSFAGGQAHLRRDTRAPMRWAAYLMAALTLGLIAVALLVGFGMLNAQSSPTDGVLWGMVSIVSALLTSAAYASIPSTVADEDYLAALVETRVAGMGTAGTTTRPGTEPAP